MTTEVQRDTYRSGVAALQRSTLPTWLGPRLLADEARPASFSAAARAAARYDLGQWHSILCPVVAIRGDHDVFTPESDHSQLLSLLPQVHAVTIPRCGHFAAVEQPSSVKELLDNLHSR
ncbi:alpha/beta fold hydrolase [Paenarthrobacter sp. NPDC092416]|uniref:alpha/beta fold hydrolase n=1 Tax=Paenarthrobacter sp. NPDC092416 TaxID=3364386 RepID=UPI00382747A9